jgi:hypothetical protein
LWLTFGGKTQKFAEAFCDADWGTQKHRHLISGYSYHIGHGAVSWSSKKQQVIALSTVESEYITQAHAVKEALWLRTFIAELRGESAQLLTINCDNQGAITMSKDNKFHTQMKHIDIQYYFICKVIKDRKVSVIYVLTNDNPADIFTKPLAKVKVKYRQLQQLGIKVGG